MSLFAHSFLHHTPVTWNDRLRSACKVKSCVVQALAFILLCLQISWW